MMYLNPITSSVACCILHWMWHSMLQNAKYCLLEPTISKNIVQVKIKKIHQSFNKTCRLYKLNLTWNVKLRHFWSLPPLFSSNFLFFHQIIALQKLWKMLFISSKKLFSFSRYLFFCISVLPSFSTSQPLLSRMIEDKS